MVLSIVLLDVVAAVDTVVVDVVMVAVLLILLLLLILIGILLLLSILLFLQNITLLETRRHQSIAVQPSMSSGVSRVCQSVVSTG